jgi:hypothetical protein
VQNAGSSGGAYLVPGLMVRHLDWSPGPLPGLRFEKAWAETPLTSSNRVLVLSERRARSEPMPLT